MPIQSQTKKCLVPNCKGVASTILKGLCSTCYQSAKKIVDAGDTTWEELTKMGLVAKKPDLFVEEFLNRRTL